MKSYKYIKLIAIALLACLSITSCTDDANDWSDGTPRQWSPVEVGVSAGDTYATLSKFYISGATGYVAQVATDDSFTENVKEYEIPKINSEDTYDITDLTPSTAYYLRIKAVSSGLEDSKWLVYSKYSNSDGENQKYFKTKASGEAPDSE